MNSLLRLCGLAVIAALLLTPGLAYAQTDAAPSGKPPRYGDAGYAGAAITYSCKSCVLPDLLLGIAVRANVPAVFPDSDKWRNVADTVEIVNAPWTTAFDMILARYQLQATWSPTNKLVIARREKTMMQPSRLFNELFADTPPLPERVLGLTVSSRAVEAERYFKEALGHYALCNESDARLALTRFSWAVQLYENVEYRGRQSAGLYFVGRCLLDLDRPEEARKAFTQALDLARNAPNQRCESLAALALARVNIERFNRREDAAQAAADAAQLIKELTARTNLSRPSLLDRIIEADIAALAGRVFYDLGEFDKAAAPLLTATALYATLDDAERNFIETLVLLERVGVRAGQAADARKFLEQARAVQRNAKTLRLQIALKAWAGTAYMQLGEPMLALEWYQDALAGLRQLGDYELDVAVQRNLARAYLALRKPSEARRFYESALRLSEENKDERLSGLVREDLKKVQ
jgi:tetratricopeptide (TPR) repeat protein